MEETLYLLLHPLLPMSPLTRATLVLIPHEIDDQTQPNSIKVQFEGMNGALSADLARVLNLQGQPASPTHMQVFYLCEQKQNLHDEGFISVSAAALRDASSV